MTEVPASLSPLELLVLTRLLPAGEKGEKPAKIRKDLELLLEHVWSGTVLIAVLDRSFIKLATLGLVAHLPVKNKKTVPALSLTPPGRQTILSSLKVSQLPAKPKPTWANLKKSLLVARALGLPDPGKALSGGAGFKAAVLRKTLALPLGDYPELKAVKTALTRRFLGMGPKEKVTLETVQAAIFARELGDQRPSDPKRILDRLVAKQVSARRDDDKELRDAVLRDWISRSLEQAGREPVIEASGPNAFVQKVQTAARECTTGRFGDNKVFIIHVWRRLQNEPDFRAMDLASFKERLAEANHARLLDLSRADLVQAMDPEDVRLSEVSYRSAVFHFIRTGSERS